MTAKLWGGILAGPAAWAIDLTASYALVHHVCRTQNAFLLNAIAGGALLIIAAGAAASWSGWQFADAHAASGRPARDRHGDRERFMAQLGLVMCAAFTMVVIAGAFPQWIIDACP